jgi:hypothetical protein
MGDVSFFLEDAAMTLPVQRPTTDQSSNTPKRQKYFVNRKETVTIRCRTCGRLETFPVANFKGRKHSVRVNCACAETFEVDLEFRQDYRQKTNITGSFRALSTPRARARQCIIADHSTGGLLLAITDEVPIKQDDRLIVCYRPNADSAHEVERIISVRHYDRGNRIGGAFIDVDAHALPHSFRHTTILH